jgi:hypothetical protein
MRKAEEEAMRKAEEEAMRKAEEEAMRKAEEEAIRKAEEEAIKPEEIDEEALISEAEALLEDMESIDETNLERSKVSTYKQLLKKNQKYGASQREFSFSDAPDTNGLVIPYTREQYLALPRKKKKRVLVHVRRLLEYNEIKYCIELLKSIPNPKPSVLERIERLEIRLSKQKGFLPSSQLWKDCIRK